MHTCLECKWANWSNKEKPKIGVCCNILSGISTSIEPNDGCGCDAFTALAPAIKAEPSASTTLWAIMRAFSWSNITAAGLPLQAPQEGPSKFIPLFDTREQAVAWQESEENIAELTTVIKDENPNNQKSEVKAEKTIKIEPGLEFIDTNNVHKIVRRVTPTKVYYQGKIKLFNSSCGRDSFEENLKNKAYTVVPKG